MVVYYHGANYLQANNTEEQKKTIDLRKKKKNLINQLRWALLFTEKGGFLPKLQGH